MNLFQVFFGALLAGSVGYTVWGYSRKYGALSGKSRLFRMVGLVLINLLLLTVLMYFSTDWNAMRYRIGIPSQTSSRLVLASQALYGTTWVLLSVLAVGTAGLDSLENFSIYRKKRREVLDEMIQEAISSSREKRAAGGGSDSGSVTS